MIFQKLLLKWIKMQEKCHPIDYRYGDDRIREIFSSQGVINTYSTIEAKVAEVQAEMGMIPEKAVKPIHKAAQQTTHAEVKQKEKEIKHDIMALVRVMAEKAGKWGEYIHWGLTSADIKDTAKIIMAKKALGIIKQKIRAVIEQLARIAYKWKDQPCVGRTHGIHANVYSFGRKFAVFAAELLRDLERIQECEDRFYVGKIAGSVGTHTALGEKGEKMERRVLKSLDLHPSQIATQVVSRDRFAELFQTLGLLASSLEKIAVEIRNLQRTELGEVEEPFSSSQVGSSAMPHKRNPIRTENITGLARIVRSLIHPALENNVLWHERDLSNSGPERALFPESFMLLAEQLDKLKSVLEGLVVYKENIERNLSMTRGLIFSERLTMELAKKIGRQKAHELVRNVAMEAYKEQREFRDAVENSNISRHLSDEKIAMLFKPQELIDVAIKQTDRVIHKVETKLDVSIP